MKYHNRDQFLGVMNKIAAESALEQNVSTPGQQPSPPPKKEGPTAQQASPAAIEQAGVNLKSIAGAQGEMKPEIVQPDEMKPTSPFDFRGPDESMSAASETAAKANASGNLAEDFENFVEGRHRTQAELRSILDNYGSQSAAGSEQAKIGAASPWAKFEVKDPGEKVKLAREHGLLDELRKISAARRA